MAPEAPERAALEEDRGTDPRPVVDAELLEIEDDAPGFRSAHLRKSGSAVIAAGPVSRFSGDLSSGSKMSCHGGRT